MLLLSRFKIYGHSMEPTIHNGQTVLVSQLPYLFSKPKINDIVAFREIGSSKIFIKRVIKIDPSADEDKYFVCGDNKKDSLDSRKIGLIERKEIVGKVIYRLSS